MNEQMKALLLGVFIIGALALVTWFILFIKPKPGDGDLLLHVRFANIDRILEGTRVTYGGRPIGFVESIKPIENPREGDSDGAGNLYMYELLLRVDSSVKIYSYDEIVFATSGLLGEKAIAIIPKAPPFGSPGAVEVTNEVLFAKTQDKIEEAFTQISNISGTFQDTMKGFQIVINENRQEFNATLCELKRFLATANEIHIIEKVAHSFVTLDYTMAKADDFISQMLDSNLVERANSALCNLQSITERIDRGEGTLGRLLTSDCLYLQIASVMAKAVTVLSDINNYGLLFQYDKDWQRRRLKRINKMYALQTPCDFIRYFDQEMNCINISLARTGELLNRMQCCQIPIQDPCFSQSFLELLGKVEHLQESLKVYTEMLMAEYCQKCLCE